MAMFQQSTIVLDAGYTATEPLTRSIFERFLLFHTSPRDTAPDVLVCRLQGFLLAIVDEIRRGDDSVVFPKDVKRHMIYTSINPTFSRRESRG
jgi:hypothetical protein